MLAVFAPRLVSLNYNRQTRPIVISLMIVIVSVLLSWPSAATWDLATAANALFLCISAPMCFLVTLALPRKGNSSRMLFQVVVSIVLIVYAQALLTYLMPQKIISIFGWDPARSSAIGRGYTTIGGVNVTSLFIIATTPMFWGLMFWEIQVGRSLRVVLALVENSFLQQGGKELVY